MPVSLALVRQQLLSVEWEALGNVAGGLQKSTALCWWHGRELPPDCQAQVWLYCSQKDQISLFINGVSKLQI